MRDLPDTPAGSPPAAELALERLGQLVQAGAAPDAVIRTAGEIIAGWADEPDIDAATAQARIGGIWDSLTKDEADLEAAISDAGDGDAAGLVLARRMQAALQAAIQAFAAAAERFG